MMLKEMDHRSLTFDITKPFFNYLGSLPYGQYPMTIQSCILQNILFLSDKEGTFIKGEISLWNYKMDILSQSFLNQLE